MKLYFYDQLKNCRRLVGIKGSKKVGKHWQLRKPICGFKSCNWHIHYWLMCWLFPWLNNCPVWYLQIACFVQLTFKDIQFTIKKTSKYFHLWSWNQWIFCIKIIYMTKKNYQNCFINLWSTIASSARFNSWKLLTFLPASSFNCIFKHLMACLPIMFHNMDLYEWHVTPSCQVLFIIHTDLCLCVTLGVATWSWQSMACRQQEWATRRWCPCSRSSAAAWRLLWSPGLAAWYNWARL